MVKFLKFFSLLLLGISTVSATYDKTAAATWAQSCAYGCTECPDDSSCGCTYFTTHAMSHGNWGHGYVGVCKDLWSGFKAGKYPGWTLAGTSESSIHKGDAVIINNGHSGDASHCCIGTGSGLVSCHNPGHKDVPASSTWYSGGYINAVYTYSSTGTYTPNQGYSGVSTTNQTDSVTNTNNPYGLLGDTLISCSPYDSDACNCVYYARDRQPKLPTGLTTCADKKSKVNSHTPAPGCVLFRTGDPTYCHAAYVTKVSNGNVYYDQANWTPCKCSSDYLSTSSTAILGYWCP